MLAKSCVRQALPQRPRSRDGDRRCARRPGPASRRDVVQVDEANLPGSPDEWQWAAAAINRVLDAVKTTPAVHLCFGNYGGQSIQKGSWDNLINYLNALHVDHIVMERPTGRRKSLPPSTSCGRRSVSPGRHRRQVNRDRVRRPDRAQHRTRRDSEWAGPDSLRSPDCGFWMLKRNIADGKIRALVEGRNLYEGRRRHENAG